MMKRFTVTILSLCVLTGCITLSGCDGNKKTVSPVETTSVPSEQHAPAKEISSEAIVENFKKTDISIDAAMQYDLNIFMSNFTEAGLKSFEGKPSAKELVQFGFFHVRLNKSSYFESCNVTIHDSEYNCDFDCNRRVSSKYVVEAVKKYFGIELTEDDLKSYDFYKDGYVYTEETGGWLSSGFAIVSKLTQVEPNKYALEFDNYSDGYMSDVKPMYKMSPSDFKKANFEYKKETEESRRSGTAVFTADNISDRGTYRLISYSIQDRG